MGVKRWIDSICCKGEEMGWVWIGGEGGGDMGVFKSWIHRGDINRVG